MRKSLAFFAVLLLVACFAIPLQNVSAVATATSVDLACGSFSAAGTSTSPYVIIYVYNYNTFQEYWAAFPVTNGNYAGQILFPQQPEGTTIAYLVWGAPLPDYYTWDNEGYYESIVPCKNSPAAPVRPADYVLRTIVCDSDLYATPGGERVGNARVFAGQTFYVSPSTVKGADGRDWYRLFVSSFVNPYVSASCVR